MDKFLERNVSTFLRYFKPVKILFMGDKVKFVLTINCFKAQNRSKFQISLTSLSIEQNQE